MEKSFKKELTGKVVSTKASKTITVQIDTFKMHPLYSKRFKVSKKIAAHDEKEVAKVGDIVTIVECRPLSATKRYRLQAVVTAAMEGAE